MTRIALVAALLLAPAAAWADGARPSPPVDGIGFDQRLGEDVPADIRLRDESGRDVRLGALGPGRPSIVVLVYYRCPMLCNAVMDGLVHGLQSTSLDPGRDYDLVCVSIDPSEPPELGAAKKRNASRAFGRPGADAGWHFLTGTEGEIYRLADAVGFRYRYDPASGQFAHAAGVVVLTPEHRVARYLFGIDFAPTDLRLALVEARGGAIASPVDAFLLYCFHWDPATGRYGAAVMNILRLGAGLTLFALGATVVVLTRRRRRLLGAGR